MYCDNTASIFFSKNDKYSKDAKHMDIKFFIVKEEIQKQRVYLEHISTDLMIVDPLTKGLPPKAFTQHVPRRLSHTAWTNEEEIALCKGWVHISENSAVDKARKECGFWTKVLWYMERKTKVLRKSTKWMNSEVPKFDRNKKDAKRSETSGSSSFNTESGDASINLNDDVGDEEEDEVINGLAIQPSPSYSLTTIEAWSCQILHNQYRKGLVEY
ncbi:hypothetical protein Tco_1278515 [Tanacetum coccineum]